MIRDLHNELAIALSMVDLPVNRLTTPLGRLATDLLGFTEGLCTVVEVALIHVKQITLEVVTRVEQLRTPEVSIGHSPRPAEALVYRRDFAQAELHHADAATDRPPRKKTPAVPLSGPRIIPIRRPPPPDEAEPPKPSAIEAAPSRAKPSSIGTTKKPGRSHTSAHWRATTMYSSRRQVCSAHPHV